jgi:hypothetical protein
MCCVGKVVKTGSFDLVWPPEETGLFLLGSTALAATALFSITSLNVNML